MSDFQESIIRELQQEIRNESWNSFRRAMLFENFQRRFTDSDGHLIDSWPDIQLLPPYLYPYPVPATNAAKKKLIDLTVVSEGQECSICLTDYKKNEVVKKMPCKHIFHPYCILTWLEKHTTCPYCRSRLH